MAVDNKLRIGQKALELFMQYGIRSVSMDDIANALGSSKKTIYQYYKDKNELVSDVIESVLLNNAHTCEDTRQKAENAVHEGFLAIENVRELMKSMNPVLMFDMRKYYPQAFKKFMQYKKQFLHKYIKENIEWGIKDGLFREDIPVELASLFRIESIDVPFIPELYENVKMDMATIQEHVFELFLYGLATPKGVKLINRYKKQRVKLLTNDKN
ncbi:MAG: TetR/AcrR family transcriptional regulator [Niabella sp.]